MRRGRSGRVHGNLIIDGRARPMHLALFHRREEADGHDWISVSGAVENDVSLCPRKSDRKRR